MSVIRGKLVFLMMAVTVAAFVVVTPDRVSKVHVAAGVVEA